MTTRQDLRASQAGSPRRGVRAAVDRHRVLAFFICAYAISWAWWLPMSIGGAHVRAGVGWPTHLPGLVGPAVAAVLVTVLADGRAGFVDLARRALRWRVGATW